MEGHASREANVQMMMMMITWEEEFPATKPKKFPSHFSCQMDSEQKRKFNPWMIQKCFTQELGAKPRTIRSKSETEFILKVNNENESKAILTITKINNVDVEITECSNINQSMG